MTRSRRSPSSIFELPVRLPQVERADVADRHQRVRAGLLRVGEDARVQVQVVVGLRLVDVAGPAAGDRLELLELEPEPRGKRLGRDVELLGRERGEAALVVRDTFFTAVLLPMRSLLGELDARDRLLALDDAGRAVATLLVDEVVERASLVDVLGDVRRERQRHLAVPGEVHRELHLLDRGRRRPASSGRARSRAASRSSSSEVTNHFACFAPMSRSMPWRIASAPSLAIASRGSTPFGQRSVQK